MNKLKIGHLYREDLNLYGDNGNIEVLVARCSRRNIPVEVTNIEIGNLPSQDALSSLNFLFMGGGPDSSQKLIYEDFLMEKKAFMKDYVSSGKCGLFVCGAYQLMGNYYRSSDGSELEGLGIFDLHTVNFGKDKPRCIGNVRAVLSPAVQSNVLFDRTVVGFENHGGRTYLNKGAAPFAAITYGSGNNSEDGTEGVLFKNCIGTYFHGPVLAKNPHLADYLIAKSLGVSELSKIDDSLTIASFSCSKSLK